MFHKYIYLAKHVNSMYSLHAYMQIVTKEFKHLHSILALSFSILLVLTATSSLFLLNVKPAMAASLTSVVTPPSNNIATIKANYEIIFTTATTTTTADGIKTITIAFPQGFSITSAILIERSGIGAGSLSLSGTTLTYSITSPVSIPSGTPIRLELAGVIQPIHQVSTQ